MSATANKISFQGGGEFAKDVKMQVKAYLAQPGVKDRAHQKLHRKAAIIIVWLVGSYMSLNFLPHSLLQIILCGVSLALATTALELCVMHDGNHKAFSTNQRTNFLAGQSLDIVGGKSDHWDKKHNQSHHGYPNLVKNYNLDDDRFDGSVFDDDSEQPPFGRFAKTQPWRTWHRWQHLYLWPTYGFVLFRWLTVGDLVALRRGKIANLPLTPQSWRQRLRYIATKLIAVGWMLGLPIALNWSWHDAAIILLIYVSLMWMASCLIISTFQLAHCVDETQYFTPQDADDNGKIAKQWMVAQVETTQDFCHGRRWRWLTWYLGGLNYQIEHHLFPHLPHTLYPAIAPIVQKMCEKHGIKYVCQPSLFAALGSHYRHLRDMGVEPATS